MLARTALQLVARGVAHDQAQLELLAGLTLEDAVTVGIAIVREREELAGAFDVARRVGRLRIVRPGLGDGSGAAEKGEPGEDLVRIALAVDRHREGPAEVDIGQQVAGSRAPDC